MIILRTPGSLIILNRPLVIKRRIVLGDTRKITATSATVKNSFESRIDVAPQSVPIRINRLAVCQSQQPAGFVAVQMQPDC
jgi:hypothetical protein